MESRINDSSNWPSCLFKNSEFDKILYIYIPDELSKKCRRRGRCRDVMVGQTKSFTLMKTLYHTDYGQRILPSLCSPVSPPLLSPLLVFFKIVPQYSRLLFRCLSIPGWLCWFWRTQHPIHTIFIMVKPFRGRPFYGCHQNIKASSL